MSEENPHKQSPQPTEDTDMWSVRKKGDGAVEVKGKKLLSHGITALSTLLLSLIVGNTIIPSAHNQSSSRSSNDNYVTQEQYQQIMSKLDKLSDDLNDFKSDTKSELSYIHGRMSINNKGTQ